MKKKYKPLILASYEIVNGRPVKKVTAEDKKNYMKNSILVSIFFLIVAFVSSSTPFIPLVFASVFSLMTLLSFCVGCCLYISGDMISINWSDELFRAKFSELKSEFKQVEDTISADEFSEKVLESERQKRKAEAEKILKKYGIDGGN